ncbi:hypothetical protein B296_00040335 [Ensete ventricosum]|uniref:Uncharacterized protein n=1 Tax=Ensete ventricosum TaxID=4639 RepID=A0A426Z7M6_ENSVE|nr:hypothetical protein B296_00040335 [Ensete ventricosum]
MVPEEDEEDEQVPSNKILVVEVIVEGVEEVGVDRGLLAVEVGEDLDGIGVVHLHPDRHRHRFLHLLLLLLLVVQIRRRRLLHAFLTPNPYPLQADCKLGFPRTGPMRTSNSRQLARQWVCFGFVSVNRTQIRGGPVPV